MRRLRLALPTALRYPAYRLYWLGMLASVGGYQMLRVGQFWIVFQITGSTLALGYVGLANAVPAIFCNLFGGVMADKIDKRRLIIATQTITVCLIFLLATLTLLDMVRVWHILTIAVLISSVEGFDAPARHALYPQLIERTAMMSAVVLTSFIWSFSRILAPAVAGLTIAWAGTATSFYLDALGFLIMVALMSKLRTTNIPIGSGGFLEGLNFIRKNFTFSYLIAVSFFSAFFGMAYIALMPVFAIDLLQVGAVGLGLLQAISGLGGLLMALRFAYWNTDRYPGFLVIRGTILFGLSLTVFVLTAEFIGFFSLALVLMFLIGVFSTMHIFAIQGSLQLMVPDRMRGRVMSFYAMTRSTTLLSGFHAGTLAGLITAPFAIAFYGLVVAIFVAGSARISSRVRKLGVMEMI